MVRERLVADCCCCCSLVLTLHFTHAVNANCWLTPGVTGLTSWSNKFSPSRSRRLFLYLRMCTNQMSDDFEPANFQEHHRSDSHAPPRFTIASIFRFSSLPSCKLATEIKVTIVAHSVLVSLRLLPLLLRHVAYT